MSQLLALAITGERTYVHGADLFDAVVGATGAETDIVLHLYSATSSAIELVAAGGGTSGDPELCGSVRYGRDGVSVLNLLRRRRDVPVPGHLPFDELAATAEAVLEAGSVEVPANGLTFVRRASAGALLLLERELPDDYWAIAEVSCRRRPPNDAAVRVATTRVLGGRYRKVSMALADGEIIGSLLLARGKPRA